MSTTIDLEILSRKLGYPVEIVSEGSVKLIVPRMEEYRRRDGVYEPAWAPVFYNPRMALNRDISVLFLLAYSELRGLDKLVVFEPLTGSGVRAVRYAVETGAYVYATDISPAAARLAALNVRINHVDELVRIEVADANEAMYRLARRGIRPTLIDIDPFGSPVPFLDAAIESLGVGGVLAITATDAAPLSGTHLHALRRRYDVTPGRTAWEKEQAVRILAGYIIRRAAVHEYGARILLAYYSDYYVRVYAELRRGARRADEALKQLSYGIYCPLCNFTGYLDNPRPRCPSCGARPVIVGPLYQGRLCDKELVEAMENRIEGMKLAEARRARKLLSQLRSECGIERPYYRLDKICSMLHLRMPRIEEVIEELERLGYSAARTHFDPRGFKTNAPHFVTINTVYQLAMRKTKLSTD